MDNSKKILYAPVQNNSEDDLALHEIRKPNKPRYRFQHFLLLEVIHLVLLLGGFVLYSAARRNAINSNIQPEARGLDTYFSLSEYSVVKEFYGDPNLVNTTAEAEALFDHIQTTDGIVALDTIWALKNGYAPSHAHPEDPTKSIYQIDMFHSMHCIYRIRNLLTSSLSLEEWPRNDHHTLHCLDYVREQLMCSPDLLLQGTTNLIEFNVNNGHTCRNSDLITDWAKSHHWAGHRQYLSDTEDFQ